MTQTNKSWFFLQLLKAGFTIVIRGQVVILNKFTWNVRHRIIVIVELLVFEFRREIRYEVDSFLDF